MDIGGNEIRKKDTIVRQSNIELLRILSMIMIIAHHVGVHSGFVFDTGIHINEFWVLFLKIGGKIGVNIFVLISGYFLIDAKTLKTSKALKLWVQIFSYSVLIYTVFVICGFETFNVKMMFEALFPITYSKWWFASAYFVLYLLFPYINKLLTALDKKEYQKLLVLMTVCWCIIPTFLEKSWQSNSLLWFIYLYALAGYLRLHMDVTVLKSGKYVAFSVAFTVFTYFSAVIIDMLSSKNSFYTDYVTYFYNMQRLPILVISVTLFIGFLNLKIGYKPLINIISSSTFGIYLIHDDRLVRKMLWKTLFQNASHKDSEYLIVYTIFEIVVVFVVCAAIELFRIYAIERIYIKGLDILAEKFDKMNNKFFNRI